MENKHVYVIIAIFSVFVVAFWIFGNSGDNISSIDMHTIKVFGPEGTPVKFNDIGTGYVNREGVLTKRLPTGTYQLECVGVSTQTLVVRQDIVANC